MYIYLWGIGNSFIPGASFINDYLFGLFVVGFPVSVVRMRLHVYVERKMILHTSP